MEYILCGFMTCAAALAVLWRMDIRKFLGYPVTLDVVAVIIFSMILHGTYVGMASALIAGLMFSASITILRRTMGYKRLSLTQGWVFYPPIYTTKETLKCLNLKSRTLWVVCIAVLLMLASAA